MDVAEDDEANYSNVKTATGQSPGHPDVPIEFVANYKIITSDKLTRKTKLKDVQSQLNQLYTGCLEIYSYAHEYDYSPSVKLNGFRSYLKVIFAYFDQMALYTRLINSHFAIAYHKQSVDTLNRFIDILPLWLHQLTSLKLIRKQKLVKQDPTEIDCPEIFPLELAVLKHQMKLNESDMEPFFDPSILGFWLADPIRKLLYFFQKFFCFILFPSVESFWASLSRKKFPKFFANLCINDSICEGKKLQNAGVYLTKIVRLMPINYVQEFIFTQRQTKWTIDPESKLVVQSTEQIEKSNIRLVIIRPKEPRTQTILFQIHGGAWISGSPEAYIRQFDNWINEIGATIVAIDYSLAPDAKFPVGLQEIVDTYLWLSESSVKGEQLLPLGFTIKDIVVTGDSAGGNLTMSLAIVLAEIKKQAPGSIKFPKALVIEYPVASPGLPYITASSTMLDILLFETLRIKHIAAYYPGCPCEPEVSYMCSSSNPWFKDEEKLVNFYKHLNGNRKEDKIFHIISYDSFHLLKSIPLYIIAAEFDSILDDSITIAKLWQGPVTLDICANVCHAFSVFKYVSPELKLADQTYIQRLKEAVEN